MERKEWLQKVTDFQACCRGYLVRRAIKCVQNEYENIVKDIEGDLNDLQWRGTVIRIPTFSEESLLFVGHDRRAKVCSNTQPECKVEEKHRATHIEEIVPERDTVPSGNTGVSCLTDGEREDEPCQEDAQEQGHTESIEDTTAALSRLGLDPGSPRRSLDRDPPQTREEARMLRNKLAMELLWIQQAIASRKKYLTLRKNLEDGTQQSSTTASI